MTTVRSLPTYNLGYALSGGGSRGFAHLGVLKHLEELDLRPQIIAGTSAGALAGVLYADGYSVDEIADMFRGKVLLDFFSAAKPTRGFFKTAPIIKFLNNNLRSKSFEELKIPFVAVATNWTKAEITRFSCGPRLVEAVVASCSVPIVFQPIKIDSDLYVDGGLLKNLPVSCIRNACRYIIGVDVSLQNEANQTTSIMQTIQRTISIMSKSNAIPDRESCDILIETRGLEEISLFNLKHTEWIQNVGYDAAKVKMGEREPARIAARCRSYDIATDVLSRIKIDR